jgi:transposase
MLLPASVRDVLGTDHLCFFVHAVVEKLDLREFVAAYGEEGGALYHPSLMLKVWLYAYALGITSSRRLEQRIREDLAFRFLAGGAQPDYWALNGFRRRHARGINDVFAQILRLAGELGMVRMGTVAIDSTRIKASASPGRVVRQEWARTRRQVRRWQQACAAADPNEGAGSSVAEAIGKLGQIEVPRMPPPKVVKRSRSDADARFLRRSGGGFVLGYTGEIAVSEDHLIVAARVTQNAHDVHALVPMTEEVERVCCRRPQRVLADSGFYSTENLLTLEQRGIEGYIPDPNLAREINWGERAKDDPRFHGVRQRMRGKLRTPLGRRLYERRKTLVEPVFGTLKEQRNLRSFRMRGLAKVSLEFMLAALAYNLTRLYARR